MPHPHLSSVHAPVLYHTPSFSPALLSKPTFFVVVTVRKAAVVLSASVTFLSLPSVFSRTGVAI
jgi:hypothetical protein